MAVSFRTLGGMSGYSSGKVNINEYILDRQKTVVSNKGSKNYYHKEFDLDSVSGFCSYFGILKWKGKPEDRYGIRSKLMSEKHSESRH